MKKRKIITAALAMTLSAATATTGIVSNPQVYVQAAENTTVKKLADSSVFGFYYANDAYGNLECTTDKTLEYSSYEEAVSKVSEITKKIIQENAYENYSFNFPVKINSDNKIEKIENDQINKDLENEVIQKVDTQ